MESISNRVLDTILTIQMGVAWAGEKDGEGARLGWWETDLADEEGGGDLFRRLLPETWRWAMYEGARAAARRTDAALRARDHDPDRLVSIYRLGSYVDGLVAQRLRDHKLGDAPPTEALPALGALVGVGGFSRDALAAWLAAFVEEEGAPETQTAPTGRRLRGPLPDDVGVAVRRLAAALVPVGDAYPLPHYHVERAWRTEAR